MDKNNSITLLRHIYGAHKLFLSLCLTLLFLSSMAATFFPIMCGKVVDYAIDMEFHSLLLYGCILVLILILQKTIDTIKDHIISIGTERIHNEFILNLYKKIMHAQYSDIYNAERGNVLQSVLTDSEAIKQICSDTVITFVFQLIIAVMASVSVILINPIIFLCVLLIYSGNLFPLKWVGTRRRTIEKELRDTSAATKQLLIQTFDTIRDIKLYGVEKKRLQDYQKLQLQWAELTQKRYIVTNCYKNIPRILDALAPAVVFLIGGYAVIHHQQSIGDIITLAGLIAYLNAPIKSFSQFYLDLKHLEAVSCGIFELLNLKSEDINLTKNQISSISSIEFKYASFCSEDQLNLLSNISFSLVKGDRMIIIGETGAGKSTILRLLAGLIMPSEGNIILNRAYDIKDINIMSLRENIAYVDQNSTVFDSSIQNNITYLNNADTVDNADYIEELGLTNLDAQSTSGLGEAVKVVSGGERQRIAFLRAYLSHRELLLLDECTSEQDKENERKMMEMLASDSTKEDIVVFTSHRLSNLRYANKVLFIADGGVVAFGNPHELYLTNSRYRDFVAHWDMQEAEV